MADDYVIYDYDNEEALTFSDMDGLREYAKNKLDARGNQCDDFAIMAYMAEIGKPFTWKSHKFVVWDDEFEGWHQYHASTKKSQPQPNKLRVKADMAFSEMVAKQRAKNIKKTSDREYDLMMQIGSLNYLLGAIRQTIVNPDIFEEIESRISRNGGISSLHDLEHILDDWHDEIEGELESYR